MIILMITHFIFSSYCQARVQVPNPLSQKAPNSGPKVRPSLKNPKTQFFGLGWHNNHKSVITSSSGCITSSSKVYNLLLRVYNLLLRPPTTFKHEGVLQHLSANSKKVLEWSPIPIQPRRLTRWKVRTRTWGSSTWSRRRLSRTYNF